MLRIFAAPLAGIAQMPFWKFFIFNLAGAATWAATMVTLAFFAGKLVSLEQLVKWVSEFAFAALFILIAIVLIPIWLESRQAKNITD